MSYLVYGSLVYSTQTNRNTALSAINSALTSYTVTDIATALPAGVNTSGTTAITISIEVPDNEGDSIRGAILSARTSATRGTGAQYIAVVKN